MTIQATGSKEVKIFEFKTDDGFVLCIKGAIPARALRFPYAEKCSVVKIKGPQSGDVFVVGEQQEFNAELSVNPLFFENVDYQLQVTYKGHELSFEHINDGIKRGISNFNDDKGTLSGKLNFGANIGFSELGFKADGKDLLSLEIEVFPQKINYKKDFQDLQEDLASEIYGLLFGFMKPTYLRFGLTKDLKDDKLAHIIILKTLYVDFLMALDLIIRQAHRSLVKQYNVCDGYKVKNVDAKCVRWLTKHPQFVQQGGFGYNVQKCMTVKKFVTEDTAENRMVRYMLQSMLFMLRDFRKGITPNSDSTTAQKVVECIDSMQKGLRRRVNETFLRTITPKKLQGSMSLVFSMAPGYKEFYKDFQYLRRGLELTEENRFFNLSVKDLNVLYEYWCFVKLNVILRKKFNLKTQDKIKARKDNLIVRLLTGKGKSDVVYELNGGEQIKLQYNRSYVANANDDYVSQIVEELPDNVLEITKKDYSGESQDFQFVFDAKYRIDYEDKECLKGGRPKSDALNKMHAYRDALVYENKEKSYCTRKMYGAYVLFPYDGDEEEYRKTKYYQAIEKYNVGGFPFLPSNTKLVEEFLGGLIEESPISVAESAILPHYGVKRKMDDIDFNNHDVLVGQALDQNHFDDYMREHIYITPANSNELEKKVHDIRYIALYQSINKFGDNAGVLFYGKVDNYYQEKRSEIPVRTQRASSNPNAIYYVFVVSEWKELPSRLKPRDYVPGAYRYSNSFLLFHAHDCMELFLRGKEEWKLYNEMLHSQLAMGGSNVVKVVDVTEKRNCDVIDYRGMKISAYKGKFVINSVIGEYDISVRDLLNNQKNILNKIKELRELEEPQYHEDRR